MHARSFHMLSGCTVLALLIAASSPAEAGFTGDNVTVSLTVHTTGAIDQTVWVNDAATILDPGGPELTGDSWPSGASSPLQWEIDLHNLGITLTVTNPNAEAIFLGPQDLNIMGLDQVNMFSVEIGAQNDFGFIYPSDIQNGFGGLTISSASLNAIPGNGSATTDFIITVPEASTMVMMALATIGLAGGYFVRRRRSS